MNPFRLSSRPIVVVGAGAVGCYYGALLARSGLPVTLIGRPAATAAILKNGVHVTSEAGAFTASVRATDDVTIAREAALAIICVKSSDTQQTAHALRNHLPDDALVLSLQNGVTNAETLLRALSQDVVAAAVYVATALEAPGQVRHFGGGSLAIGSPRERPVTPERMRQLAEMLREAAIDTTVSEDIASVLWGKLAVNCAYNGLSALTQQPYGALMASPAIREVIQTLASETIEVARARQIDLPDDMLDRVMKVADLMPGQRSSTAQDLARGRPTEIDFLNGYVAAEGKRLGIPTPANQTVFALVKQVEPAATR